MFHPSLSLDGFHGEDAFKLVDRRLAGPRLPHGRDRLMDGLHIGHAGVVGFAETKERHLIDRIRDPPQHRERRSPRALPCFQAHNLRLGGPHAFGQLLLGQSTAHPRLTNVFADGHDPLAFVIGFLDPRNPTSITFSATPREALTRWLGRPPHTKSPSSNASPYKACLGGTARFKTPNGMRPEMAHSFNTHIKSVTAKTAASLSRRAHPNNSAWHSWSNLPV
ncbi:hypothetical protein KCV01_g1155, partial [Aureobasidium melanogenum]